MRTELNLTLYLVRHGMTPTNFANQTVGQSPDEPLSDQGKEQAKLLGARLRKEITFDHIYCSSYARAHQTLVLADPKVSGTYNTGITALREIDQGTATGKLRTEVFKTPEDFERMKRNGMGYSFPNGETQYDVQHRARTWLDNEVINNPYTRTDQPVNILIMSHGMTLKCLLHSFFAFDHRSTGRILLDNTSISRVALRRGDWHLLSINDTAHLHNTEFMP